LKLCLRQLGLASPRRRAPWLIRALLPQLRRLRGHGPGSMNRDGLNLLFAGQG